MIFDEILGLKEIPENEKVIYRDAVRAIAFNSDNQVIMVQSRDGDYQFPGGGLENGESQLETLKREALEEAGIVIKDAAELIGVVEEGRKSLEIEDAYFVMKSTYYLCYVEEYVDALQLEEYEKEWGFTPVRIELAEAYKKNLSILTQREKVNPWVERDTLVLKYLVEHKEELLEIGRV